MKLSKEQKDELIGKLSTTWGAVDLMCDGYLVSLRVECYKALSYRVTTYVNGFFKGVWCRGKDPAPEAKFLRKSVRPNLSPAKRKQAEKTLGKRYVAKDPYFGGSVTVYLPDWSSGRAAINHLCRVCDSVAVADKDEAAAIRAAGAASEADPALAS